MEKSFSNLQELREEICRLKSLKQEQEALIAEKFSSPGATISTLFALIRGKKHPGDHRGFFDTLISQDLVTTISRVFVPFMVNKLFFRKAGFITKAIASFLSQKAAKNVNTGVLTELAHKVAGFFSRKQGTANKTAVADYGIPPDSETS
jgi:hypothetical protein